LTSNAGPFIIGVLASFEVTMQHLLNRLWYDDQAQDIAEYAVMLAVILLLVVGTIKLIGTNASSTFSSVANTMQ
jgi:Flp pilus assembly pilin Flp